MKSDSLMKIFILFFVVMIFIPPILRLAVPKDEVDIKNATSTNDVKKLICENEDDSIIITNNYLKGKLVTLVFSSDLLIEEKNNNEEKDEENNIVIDEENTSEGDETSIENTTETESTENTESTESTDKSLIDELKELKLIKNGTFSENTLTFNFSANDFSEVEQLKKYTKNIEEQKTLNEQAGLKCVVSDT